MSDWAKLTRKQRFDLRHTFRRLKTISPNPTLDEGDGRKLERFIDDYGFWDGRHSHAHIFDLACHINHACPRCANAGHYVDAAEPNTMTIRTMRKIRPGEELFIHYGKSDLPYGCAVCNAGARPGVRELMSYPFAAVSKVRNWLHPYPDRGSRSGRLTTSDSLAGGYPPVNRLGLDGPAVEADNASGTSTLVPADDTEPTVTLPIEVLMERERWRLVKIRKEQKKQRKARANEHNCAVL
ncbi:Fc.00g063360.m01.CDS01 [Cosmosporella sp. VM-42]